MKVRPPKEPTCTGPRVQQYSKRLVTTHDAARPQRMVGRAIG